RQPYCVRDRQPATKLPRRPGLTTRRESWSLAFGRNNAESMPILVTGAAGFIGYHVSAALLARGESVIGVDTVNDYYDVALKEGRLAQLAGKPGFRLHRVSIADRTAMQDLVAKNPGIDRIVHLAAQPGVRYSLLHPFTYAELNLKGQLVQLEVVSSMT